MTGFMIGLYMSARLKWRVLELEAMLAMLEEMSLQIRYRALSVYELIESLDRNPTLERLQFIKGVRTELEQTRNFQLAWETGVQNAQTSLNEGDKEILRAIGLRLGTSDIDGQLSNIELHSQLVKSRLNDAKEEQTKKGKMYRSLAPLIALGVSILII